MKEQSGVIADVEQVSWQREKQDHVLCSHLLTSWNETNPSHQMGKALKDDLVYSSNLERSQRTVASQKELQLTCYNRAV